MELAITRLSPNGQVVIPAGIRTNAGLKQGTQFLVFQERGIVFLKELKRSQFEKDLALAEKLARAEEQVRKGQYTAVDSRISPEETDRILMGDRRKSITRTSSRKRSGRSRIKR